MQDEPSPDAILAAVAAQLRSPAEEPQRARFEVRVSAGAIELARRALSLGPAGEARECERLVALLGDRRELAALNAALAQALRNGVLDLVSSGVREHLWATTLEKLAVDQPSYATYRAVLAERGAVSAGEA